MKYNRLGKTDLKVSELGFGGLPIMSGRDSDFLVRLKGTSKDEAVKTLRKAYESGINFFDTARSYRDSEEKIGKALKSVRNSVIIASKSHALSYHLMKKDVEKSLRNLGTDYIDLYQLHYVQDSTSYDRIMDPADGAYVALAEMKDKGIIREIGIASHNATVLKPAIKSGYFSTVQLPLNLLEQECLEVINLAKERRMGIITMKPFGGGALVRPLPKLENLGISGKEMKILALRYVLTNNIDTVIPGMANRQELEENLKIYQENEKLSPTRLKLIDEIKNRLGNIFCRRCRYCEPCPKNIEISIILRLIKYFENYNLGDWAKEQYTNLEVKANTCQECHSCESKCPYNLKIVDELKRIHKILGSK